MRRSIPPKSSADVLGRILSDWRNRRVLREISPPFLDIACGTNRLCRLVPGGFGVDIVDHGGADCLVADFGDLPFRPDTFATITIVASLNYFHDPGRVLSACANVLAPAGRILITAIDPAIGRMWHAVREPWARLPGFSRHEIEALAAQSGLAVAGHRRFMLGLNHLYILTKALGGAGTTR